MVLKVFCSSEVEEDNKRLILVDNELKPGPDATEDAHPPKSVLKEESPGTSAPTEDSP